MTTGDLFDFGPFFDDGILTVLPPILLGSPYPAFVPRIDADGNDIAGIRSRRSPCRWRPTAAGRCARPPLPGDDLCDAFGQKIDFRQTRAERLAIGDPRLSIEERYQTHEKYVMKVRRAAKQLWLVGLFNDPTDPE